MTSAVFHSLPARVLAALALLIGFGGIAQAHTKSETQSIWRIVGSTVHVAYTIPDIEIKRLAHPDCMPMSDSELADYVTDSGIDFPIP